MKRQNLFRISIAALSLSLLATIAYSQGTLADYERAFGLRDKLQGKAVNLPERANWIEKTSRFWYRKSVVGGSEFVLVDAETLAKRSAFDHERLATALSAAANEKYSALKLPFQEISFVDGEKAIEFNIGEVRWRCDLADYSVQKLPPNERGGQRRGGGISMSTGLPGPRYNFPQTEAKTSPDGKLEAWVNNFNVWVRPKGKREGSALSFDGSEGNYYALLRWSGRLIPK